MPLHRPGGLETSFVESIPSFPLHGLWESNSGHQTCMAKHFACQVILLTLVDSMLSVMVALKDKDGGSRELCFQDNMLALSFLMS